MISLEARRKATEYEKENPNVLPHEAFIQGYLYATQAQPPMMLDDAPLELVSNPTLSSFEDFWNLYDKKRGKPKAEKLWNKLPLVDHIAIMEYIPKYKMAQPDKQYRKDPQTFLRNRAWEDELIFSNTNARPTAADQERDFFEQSVQSFIQPNN